MVQVRRESTREISFHEQMLKKCEKKYSLKAPIISVCCFIAGASSAKAGDLYVSTTGSDGNPGTLSRPFKTINAAASAAGPGTNVFVRGGTYTGKTTISRSGTQSAYIKFLPYPGERVILDGQNSTEPLLLSGKYLEIRSFEVKNSRGVGVTVWGTHHVRVIGMNVHDSQLGGIWLGYDSYNVSHDNYIAANTVFNNCLRNSSRSMSGGWPAALQSWKSKSDIVKLNKVYRNYGEGLSARLSELTLFDGNTSFDNYSANVYIDGAPSVTVQRNFVYSTGDVRFFTSGKPSLGIAAAIEYGGRPLSNLRVINNIVLGTRWGFYYGNFDQGGGMQNAVIQNNTIVNATQSAMHIDTDRHSGNYVRNNILYSAARAPLATGSASGSTFSNNCWWGGSYSLFYRSGDKVANPLLVTVGAQTPDGYKIQSTSPCARFIPLASSAPNDFWNVARAPTTSAGAHQP